jgi:hypothetical protein
MNFSKPEIPRKAEAEPNSPKFSYYAIGNAHMNGEAFDPNTIRVTQKAPHAG